MPMLEPPRTPPTPDHIDLTTNASSTSEPEHEDVVETIDLSSIPDDTDVSDSPATLPLKGENSLACFNITAQHKFTDIKDALRYLEWDDDTNLFLTFFGEYYQVFDWCGGENTILKLLHPTIKAPMTNGKCIIVHEENANVINFFRERPNTNSDVNPCPYNSCILLDGSQCDCWQLQSSSSEEETDDEDEPPQKKTRVE